MDCGDMIHTRKVYGETLIELGEKNKDIVVVDADLSSSTQTVMFARKYPERFFNVGCAEQNLIGLSAGLALSGKTVFTSAFAMFGAGRGWEQIRNTVAYDSLNVKLVFTHAGLTVGKDGSSHQIIEDLCLMRVIPGMKVQVPADPVETKHMITAAAEYGGPIYIRLTREKSPVLFEDYKYQEKPHKMVEGSDVTLFSCGYMLAQSIDAAAKLKKEGISASLYNVNTIKPLDADTVASAVSETGAAVTAEEHSIVGGLGSAVSEVLCEKYPSPLRRVGIQDRFGKSGSAKDLMTLYNLTSDDIVAAARDAVKARK